MHAKYTAALGRQKLPWWSCWDVNIQETWALGTGFIGPWLWACNFWALIGVIWRQGTLSGKLFLLGRAQEVDFTIRHQGLWCVTGRIWKVFVVSLKADVKATCLSASGPGIKAAEALAVPTWCFTLCPEVSASASLTILKPLALINHMVLDQGSRRKMGALKTENPEHK